MPELPEVETIRTQLIQYLHLKIERIAYSSFAEKIIKVVDVVLEGYKIEQIDRKGKMLDFILDGGNRHLISQLGMTGGWRVSPEKSYTEGKHEHIKIIGKYRRKRIIFSYIDPRRFGRVFLLRRQGAEDKLNALGVDIASKNLSSKYIYSIINKHPKLMIKPLLLEQKYFAGVGNYIASEMCARAGILPTRLCRDITYEDTKRIRQACKLIIDRSIKHKGLSFHGGYFDANGKKGDALNDLVVFYQKSCGMCKSEVQKIELKGRGTYFCSSCQH